MSSPHTGLFLCKCYDSSFRTVQRCKLQFVAMCSSKVYSNELFLMIIVFSIFSKWLKIAIFIAHITYYSVELVIEWQVVSHSTYTL